MSSANGNEGGDSGVGAENRYTDDQIVYELVGLTDKEGHEKKIGFPYSKAPFEGAS